MKLPARLGLKVGLFVAVATIVCAHAPIAGALPANEVETDYFSDATFTNEIGSSTLFCNGSHFREGRTSRFTLRFATPCNGGGIVEVACVVDGVPTRCPPSICDSELFSCS